MRDKSSISVLMPVYNAEPYIGKAVESILKQTFTDFEFIIINDGSTDRSLQILQHYAHQDDRIRLVSRENRGLVKTLNEGLDLADAPLIARMDADDIAVPERFALQKDFMDNNPDFVCVGGRVRVIDEKSRFLIIADTKLDHEEIELSALQGITPICHPTAMLRKDKLNIVGGYQQCDYPAEDLGLFLNLSELGRLGNLSNIVLEYRIHNHSISTTTNEFQMQKSREICEKHWKKRGREYPFLALEGRPGVSRASKFDITLKHGWWAFNSKQWKTAVIYGLKSIAINPFKQDGWRLFICGLIKWPK
ncbi:MAG: glycosyltransferase [Methyloglobulus sp.]|nr:glycosyltransferase [Methyloglobulus sp.]